MRPQLDVLANACYYYAGLAETLTGASLSSPSTQTSAVPCRTTRGTTSRYFAGTREVHTSAGSVRWLSASMISSVAMTR